MTPDDQVASRPRDVLEYERTFWGRGRSVAGVDEAGRGPLAGPVVAAAVILPPDTVIEGADDSKQLAAEVREEIFDRIVSTARCVGVGAASVRETVSQVTGPSGISVVPWMRTNSSTRSMGLSTSERKLGTVTLRVSP